MLCVRALSRCEQGLFSRCGAWASHCDGFSYCRTLILGAWASVIAECGLRSCGTWGLTAPQHMRSSWTRDQASVPYTARQILNLWTTREAPPLPAHSSQCFAWGEPQLLWMHYTLANVLVVNEKFVPLTQSENIPGVGFGAVNYAF